MAIWHIGTLLAGVGGAGRFLTGETGLVVSSGLRVLLDRGALRLVQPTVLTRPCLYGRALPDLPHRQLVVGLGEVAPGDDLLDALPGQSAEHEADLGSADKVARGLCHIGIMSCHLTSR